MVAVSPARRATLGNRMGMGGRWCVTEHEQQQQSTPIGGMRVTFYGTQGSGSTFPGRDERQAMQELCDYELLRRVFDDLNGRAGDTGRLGCSVEDILGGPINRRTLQAYRRRFDVPEPRVYGGWTTCVRVETADGYDIVFDCGSGFR